MKLEILNIDTRNGSFLLRVNDLNLIPQVLTHIVDDSPVAGDTHNTIVIGSCIAVETDSVGRARTLANEIKEKFNGKEA